MLAGILDNQACAVAVGMFAVMQRANVVMGIAPTLFEELVSIGFSLRCEVAKHCHIVIQGNLRNCLRGSSARHNACNNVKPPMSFEQPMPLLSK